MRIAGILLSLLLAVPGTSFAVVVLDNTSLGFYNNSLGTMLNGTNPVVDDNGVNTFLFPNNDSNPNDPSIASVGTAPDLSAAAGILGDWLGDPGNLNANWMGPQAIPLGWDVDSETAIVYAFDAQHGMRDIDFDFGVDNGIFVWLDGAYMGGQMAPGGPALGEFSFNVAALSGGTHYLQVLREDHGGATGYSILVDGDFDAVAVPTPGTGALIALGLMALLGARLRRP